MRRWMGFTLIELLVVIAVISLLAGILFPVFAQVRSAARKITCLSNVRQIGLAARMYVQDYDDTLLSPLLQRPGNPAPTAYSNLFLGRRVMTWPELLLPYTRNLDIYTCPNRRDSPYWGYAMNCNSASDFFPGSPTPPGEWNDGTPGRSSPMVSNLISEATTIWFYDADPNVLHVRTLVSWTQFEEFARQRPDSATLLALDGSRVFAQILREAGSRAEASTVIQEPWRHAQGMNVSWCDGHATFVRPSRIKEEWWNIENMAQPKE